MCRQNPRLGPRGPSFPWKDRLLALQGVWGVLILFLLVTGGLYFGIFTPTEAGAGGAFGAFLFALLRRRMTTKVFISSLKETARTTCMALTILIGAMIFSSFMAMSGIPRAICVWVTQLPLPTVGIIGVVLLMYIPLGALMDALPMMLLTLPFIFPALVELGADPIWFGVLLTLMCEVALITPPVGLNVYAISGASGVPMERVFRGSGPFVVIMLVGVTILLVFPQISLFLPSMMK